VTDSDKPNFESLSGMISQPRIFFVIQLFSNTLPLSDNVSKCQGTNSAYECCKISSTKGKTLFFKFARAGERTQNLFVFQFFLNTLPLRYSVSQCQGTNSAYESFRISSTKCKNHLPFQPRQGLDICHFHPKLIALGRA
jgi:hypothetical protein